MNHLWLSSYSGPEILSKQCHNSGDDFEQQNRSIYDNSIFHLLVDVLLGNTHQLYELFYYWVETKAKIH